MSYIDSNEYPKAFYAPFKFKGIWFDDVNPDEDEFLFSQICQKHIDEHQYKLEGFLHGKGNHQCGIYGCEEPAVRQILFYKGMNFKDWCALDENDKKNYL